jgi:hypothetical protein
LSSRPAGVSQVTGICGSDLVVGEVAQGERVGLDVERARGRRLLAAAGSELVVAHVLQSHEREGVGESRRPVAVAVADLAEDGAQGLTLERVDLVEEDHQGPRRRARPSAEGRS